MYLVVASIKITNPAYPARKYQNIQTTGFYQPTGKQASKKKIEAECKEYLISDLKKSHPAFLFELSKLTIKRKNFTFFLKEGTQS